MGLDMYLERKYYVGGHWEHREVTGGLDMSVDGKEFHLQGRQIETVREHVGYWRKANAIHGWFVRECQDGVDECQDTYVSYEKLTELVTLCRKLLLEKSPDMVQDLLPPQKGFFFGSAEVDEWYWQDLEDTIKIIDGLDPDGEYYYRSSW